MKSKCPVCGGAMEMGLVEKLLLGSGGERVCRNCKAILAYDPNSLGLLSLPKDVILGGFPVSIILMLVFFPFWLNLLIIGLVLALDLVKDYFIPLVERERPGLDPDEFHKSFRLSWRQGGTSF